MLKYLAVLSFVISLLFQPALADHPSIGIQGSLAGPVITSTAQQLPEGDIAYSFDVQYLQFDAVSDRRLELASEQDEDVHSADSLTRTAFNLSYGVNNRLTLGFSLPYIERSGLAESAHHDEDEDEEEEEHHDDDEAEEAGFERLGDASGIGDARFYGSYSLWSRSSSQAALLFGVKAPTGSTSEKADSGERLETELQPGSGSWDSFVGIAYSRPLGNWALDSNLLYTATTEGSQDTELGDVFNYNLSLARPIYGHSDEGHQHAQPHADLNINLVFEVNGEWRDQTEVAGEEEGNSGGSVVYVSPGIHAAYGKWSLSVSAGLPFHNLKGLQSEPEARLIFKLGRSF